MFNYEAHHKKIACQQDVRVLRVYILQHLHQHIHVLTRGIGKLIGPIDTLSVNIFPLKSSSYVNQLFHFLVY